MSKIEWTEKTWNPVTGCTKVSEACRNCYAEVMAKRLNGMPATKDKYKNGFAVTLHPDALNEPYKWRKPQMVFVCSMGDLFHNDVPFEYIDRVMDVIRQTPQHTYQLLTKRPSRMETYFNNPINGETIPKNVWLGTTVESSKYYYRIEYLRNIHCDNVKFMSCEPLLDNMLRIELDGIDWVITGGESGVNARPTPANWFRNLRHACVRQNVPFYFKQWGAWGDDGVKRSKYANGCLLDGREWKEYPNVKTNYDRKTRTEGCGDCTIARGVAANG